MGRWAQRRRTGGGNAPTAGQILGHLVAATIDDATHATGTWNVPVSAGDFDAADFTSASSQETGISIAQAGTYALTVEFSGTITGDADFEYTGDTANLLTPDTVAY